MSLVAIHSHMAWRGQQTQISCASGFTIPFWEGKALYLTIVGSKSIQMEEESAQRVGGTSKASIPAQLHLDLHLKRNSEERAFRPMPDLIGYDVKCTCPRNSADQVNIGT